MRVNDGVLMLLILFLFVRFCHRFVLKQMLCVDQHVACELACVGLCWHVFNLRLVKHLEEHGCVQHPVRPIEVAV